MGPVTQLARNAVDQTVGRLLLAPLRVSASAWLALATSMATVWPAVPIISGTCLIYQLRDTLKPPGSVIGRLGQLTEEFVFSWIDQFVGISLISFYYSR